MIGDIYSGVVQSKDSVNYEKLNRIRWKLHDLAEELVGEDGWLVFSTVNDGILCFEIDTNDDYTDNV